MTQILVDTTHTTICMIHKTIGRDKRTVIIKFCHQDELAWVEDLVLYGSPQAEGGSQACTMGNTHVKSQRPSD